MENPPAPHLSAFQPKEASPRSLLQELAAGVPHAASRPMTHLERACAAAGARLYTTSVLAYSVLATRNAQFRTARQAPLRVLWNSVLKCRALDWTAEYGGVRSLDSLTSPSRERESEFQSSPRPPACERWPNCHSA